MHVVQKSQLNQQGPILCKDATLFFLPPGRSLPSSTREERDRPLSIDGIKHAKLFAKNLAIHNVDDIDLVIIGPTERARETAHWALDQGGAIDRYNAKGTEFYGPAKPKDFEALETLEREIETHRSVGLPLTEQLQTEADRLLEQYRTETRQVALSIPGIKTKRCIVLICDPVFGNPAVAALFPQHAAKLKTIDLHRCYGHCLQVTEKECIHHIPFRVPRLT